MKNKKETILRYCRKIKILQHFTLVELLIVVAIIAILASLLLPALHKAKQVAHSAVCLNNLKQHGAAVHFYVGDYDSWMPTAFAGWSSSVSSQAFYHEIAEYLGYEKTVLPFGGDSWHSHRADQDVDKRVPEILTCLAKDKNNRLGYAWNYYAGIKEYSHPDGATSGWDMPRQRFGKWYLNNGTTILKGAVNISTMIIMGDNLNSGYNGNSSIFLNTSLYGIRHRNKSNFLMQDGHAEPLTASELQADSSKYWKGGFM